MAYFAILKFGSNDSGRYNKEYPVVTVRSRFSRPHNGVKPSSSAGCDGITLTMPVPPRTDLEIYDWFIGRDVLSGCIEFDESYGDGTDSSRIIRFENARCISLREDYEAESGERSALTITMDAEEIITSGISFERYD